MKKKYLITGIIILMVLCAGVGIGTILSRKGDRIDDSQGVTLDKSAEGYEEEGDTPEEQESIRFPGYPEITIDAGREDIPIVLTNPETNPCYFQFSISLDGGDPIYESEWVKPGDAIREFDLTTAIEPGDYEIYYSDAMAGGRYEIGDEIVSWEGSNWGTQNRRIRALNYESIEPGNYSGVINYSISLTDK